MELGGGGGKTKYYTHAVQWDPVVSVANHNVTRLVDGRGKIGLYYVKHASRNYV